MMMPRPNFNWLRNHGVVAILVVAYVFMSLLIVEQGRTIDNQKSLIRLLYADSMELSVSKLHHATPKK
jgi:hypothetical protein